MTDCCTPYAFSLKKGGGGQLPLLPPLATPLLMYCSLQFTKPFWPAYVLQSAEPFWHTNYYHLMSHSGTLLYSGLPFCHTNIQWFISCTHTFFNVTNDIPVTLIVFIIKTFFINPWRAYAMRVTVLGLCVCVCVYAHFHATANKSNDEGCRRLQYYKHSKTKITIFLKWPRSSSRNWQCC